jgi:hypothetical protein
VRLLVNDGDPNLAIFSTQWRSWASTAGVSALVGKFGSSFTDIALTGGAGWTNIKLARSNGDGTFVITDGTIGNTAWGSWAAQAGMRRLVGYFNADGDERMDIALVGAAGRTSIAVAHSNGDGSFSVVDRAVPNFPGWAATPGATVVTGFFDNDRYTDIALTGVFGWATIPVAFGSATGFQVTNQPVTNFATWAAAGGVTKHVGNADQ